MTRPGGEAAGGDRYPHGLLRFIDRFDRGEYWLAHEDLEEVWMDDRRDAYKGLIHVAAALLHAERGNRRGARSKIDSALRYLEQEPGVPGFSSGELTAMVRELGRRLGTARTSGDLAAWAAERPPLRPLFDDDVPEGIAPAEELPYRVRRHDRGYRTRRDPSRRD